MELETGLNVHLFPTENQSLLHGRNAFFLFDSLFYPLDLSSS